MKYYIQIALILIMAAIITPVSLAQTATKTPTHAPLSMIRAEIITPVDGLICPVDGCSTSQHFEIGDIVSVYAFLEITELTGKGSSWAFIITPDNHAMYIPETAIRRIEATNTPTDQSSSIPSSTATDDPQAGVSRSNPVPFGASKSVEALTWSATITVRDFNEYATGEVLERDSSNEMPGANVKYVSFEIEITCESGPDETCDIGWNDFVIVGDNGEVYESDILTDGFSSNTEVFGGSTITFSRPFIVANGTTDFVIFQNYVDSDDRIYFATK